MSPDERVYFEGLRKSNPEIDQLVVEHTFFMQQLNRFDETKKLKRRLNSVHTELAEKGLIKSPGLQGKAKVIYLFNRYKRTAAIAASIAGITALTMSALIWSFSPAKPNDDIIKLNREISALKNQNKQQNKEINTIKQNISTPAIAYKTGGTGFLIDQKGYVVTNAHIIQNANNIVVQNSNGKDLNVTVVFVDVPRDIAILKITDTSFKTTPSIPYSIKKTSAEIAEPIYTLGFPRNEIVYGEGYLAAKPALMEIHSPARLLLLLTRVIVGGRY
jgi:S1-C subfamily serine protease